MTGYGAGTGGSRSGSMIAGAVQTTATVLRERIITIAAHEARGRRRRHRACPRERHRAGHTVDLDVSLGRDRPDRLLRPGLLPPGVPPGLEHSGRYQAVTAVNWANASHVCTCEVDIETGKVTLLRHIVSENCGAMINPNIVEGQIAGGTVQGIAGALFEDLAYDEDGNPIASTLLDYVMPTAAEVPGIEYAHYDTPGPGPGGYKGIGEGGVLGAAPATVNAVADALSPFGVRLNRLPLSPACVLDALRAARRA